LNPHHDLYLVNNTLVNMSGVAAPFVSVDGSVVTPVIFQNNLFVGPGEVSTQPYAVRVNNHGGGAALFVDLSRLDLRLRPRSRAVNGGKTPGEVDGFSLRPQFQYKHPACLEVRRAAGPIDIGAYELGPSGGPAEGAPARCREKL
jgi:hypothetical protein